jgi:hypothetical protein
MYHLSLVPGGIDKKKFHQWLPKDNTRLYIPDMNSHSHSDNSVSTETSVHTHSVEYIHSTHTTLSEPEDDMSSGVESFDMVDMYPAHYDDESVQASSESEQDSERNTGTTVCVMDFQNLASISGRLTSTSLMRSLQRYRSLMMI